MNIIAQNPNELLTLLSKTDIFVPSRGEGRTSSHTERYTIAHLLSSLLKQQLLAFPLALQKRERPDFVLTLAKLTIGLEVSEVVHANQAEITALANRTNCDTPFELSYFRPGMSIGKDLQQKLLKGTAPHSGGWVGNQPEIAWADAAIERVLDKTSKLNNGGYELYDENWLSLYHNYFLPYCDMAKASKLLTNKLIDVESNFEQRYGSIFIEDGAQIVYINKERAAVLLSLNDLWVAE